MPASQFEYDNFVAGAVNTPNATEGVIATTRSVSSAFAGSQFGIKFYGVFFAGATATFVTFQIRQASLTGLSVYNSAPIAVTAGNRSFFSCAVVDSLAGESAGAVWVLTATQTAGTGAGIASNVFSAVTVPV